MATKHTLWSSEIEIKDWIEDIRDYMPEASENEIYEEAVRVNESYLDDLRGSFNKKLNERIVVIGELGLWNGKRMGYKLLSNNLKDCFYGDIDSAEWYVDGYNDLRCNADHHDGTNHYLYRVFKDNLSDYTKENFLYKVSRGVATRQDITRYTTSLGKYFKEYYGW